MSPSLVSQFRGSHWYGVGKSRLTLGPFRGGLNTNDDPQFVNSQVELQDCVNYMILPDGRLVCRPQATRRTKGITALASSVALLGTSYGGLGIISPVASAWDGTNTRFYTWNGLTQQWVAAFTGGVFLTTNIKPKKVHQYGAAYYFTGAENAPTNTMPRLYSSPDVGTNPTIVAGFTTSVTANVTVPGSFNGYEAFVDSFVVKDRLVVILRGGTILYSKATDPSTWATPDGGFVYLRHEVTSAAVLNDAIYMAGDEGVWRFSWISDPAVDGSIEQITPEPVHAIVEHLGQLYVATKNGVFTLQNGYMSEISGKIAKQYAAKFDAMTTQNYDPSGIGLTVLDNFLLVGPLPGPRVSSVVSTMIYDLYYVFDFRSGVWTSWGFNGSNGNSGTVMVSGPQRSGRAVFQSYVNVNANSKFFWAYMNNSGLFQGVASMDAVALRGAAASYPVTDIDDTVATQSNFVMIGQKFQTADIDLSDADRFKRVFLSVMEAILDTSWAPNPFVFANTGLSIVTDGVETLLRIGDTDKLAFGKSYRAKKFSLKFTSLLDVRGFDAGNPALISTSQPILNYIDRIHTSVTSAREVTT